MTDTILSTPMIPTWCPGCWNFQILTAVKNVIGEEIKKGKKKDDFAIVAGIGCHAKIFDYINLNGINTLHGRVLPTCLGMKVGNPNLNVIGFSGDGDAYAEGMEHLVHAARYNSDFKFIVSNNQVFALTIGQSTPTTAPLCESQLPKRWASAETAVRLRSYCRGSRTSITKCDTWLPLQSSN